MSETPERLAEKCRERRDARDRERIQSERIKAGLARWRKSHGGLPTDMVKCIAAVKMSAGPLAVYYSPRSHSCSIELTGVRAKPGTLLVGIYDPSKMTGKGKLWELEAMVREDLEEVLRESGHRAKP